MAIILFIIAVSLSAIAAFYAVSGLVAIFAAAAVPIAIMGGVLEAGKLVVASWLYRRWDQINLFMKTYLVGALVVLMLLTSMGIFGFLSKSHLDQAGEKGNNDIRIAQIERQIEREKKTIADAEKVIGQLDQAVQVLLDADRIRGPNGSIAVRASQKDERDQLSAVISYANSQIVQLEEQRQPLLNEKLALELEIGPLKYVAEFIYGDEAPSHFDEAVRWVILLIIFVFDPLAVMLLIAWNREVMLAGETRIRVAKEPEDSYIDPFSYSDSKPAYESRSKPKDPPIFTPPPTPEFKAEPEAKPKFEPRIDIEGVTSFPEPEPPVAAPVVQQVDQNPSDVVEQVYKPVHGRPDRLK